MDAAPLDWRPDSVFVQAGASARDARVAALGLRWDLPWPRTGPVDIEVKSAMQLSLGRWSTGVTPRGVPREGRDHAVQLVAMPLVRWQLRHEHTAWFIEAGLGVSFHDRIYRVERKRQGSRLNFQEEIALGRVVAHGHEWSLRLAHMSNAGLREPNPGETWWSVRWDLRF